MKLFPLSSHDLVQFPGYNAQRWKKVKKAWVQVEMVQGPFKWWGFNLTGPWSKALQGCAYAQWVKKMQDYLISPSPVLWLKLHRESGTLIYGNVWHSWDCAGIQVILKIYINKIVQLTKRASYYREYRPCTGRLLPWPCCHLAAQLHFFFGEKQLGMGYFGGYRSPWATEVAALCYQQGWDELPADGMNTAAVARWHCTAPFL